MTLPTNPSGWNSTPNARPPWKLIDTQPLLAFHTSTGENSTSPIPTARYGPGESSKRRARGVTRMYNTAAAGRNTA